MKAPPTGPGRSALGRLVGGHWPARAAAGGSLALAVVLGAAVLDVPGDPAPLAGAVSDAVPESGVTHPVTAVLLNLRAYDTWLEMAVLLAAAVAALALSGSPDLRAVPHPVPSSLLPGELARVLVPVLVLITVFIVSRGTFTAGGAFQAGAALSAAALLLWLAGHPSLAGLPGGLLRLLLVAGVAAFALVAGATLVAGRPLLGLPTGAAGSLIVALEGAITVTVGASLALLFVAARAPR